MQGLEKIRARIMDEARAKAEANLKQAEKEAGRIMEAARAKAEQKRAELLEKAGIEATEAEKRIIALAELELRKQKLKAKQDLVEEAFRKTLEKLSSMPPEQYAEVITGMILEAVQDGSGEIIFSNYDRSRLDVKNIIERVNRKLLEAGKTGTVSLSSEERDFTGGFILKRGNIEINNTFEVLIKVNREELEHVALTELFG